MLSVLYRTLTFIVGATVLIGVLSCGKDKPTEAPIGSEIPSILSPANASQVADLVDIIVVVLDDKGIAKVDFFIDNDLAHTDVVPPYSYQWNTDTLADSTVHSLFVKAEDTDGNTTGSELIIVTLIKITGIPDSPLVHVSNIKQDSFTLTWSRFNDNDFEAYEVYLDSSSASDTMSFLYDRIKTIDDTVLTIGPLQDGWQYIVGLKVIDLFNNFAESDVLIVNTLDVSPELSILSVHWKPNLDIVARWSSNNDFDFDHYELLRLTGDSMTNDFVLLYKTLNRHDTVFVDKTVDTSEIYFYKVRTVDVNGNSAVSTLIGGSYSELTKNFSLRFENGALATIPFFPQLNIVDRITVEAWIKPIATISARARILDHPHVSHTNPHYQWALSAGSSTFCTGAGFTRTSSGRMPPQNLWTHIAMTYNLGVVRIYYNGVLENSYNIQHPRPCSESTNLFIGRLGNLNGFNFVGLIDEIRIWSVARTETEILSNFNSVVLSDPNLIEYWSFNEGFGQLVTGTNSNVGFLGSTPDTDGLDPVWSLDCPPLR